jgi:hypothetical protein
MSQDKLGKAIGVGRMTIVRTERGDREDCPASEIPVSRAPRDRTRRPDSSLEFFLVGSGSTSKLSAPSLDDRLSQLLEAGDGPRSPRSCVTALNPEQLEAEQRQFLERLAREYPVARTQQMGTKTRLGGEVESPRAQLLRERRHLVRLQASKYVIGD